MDNEIKSKSSPPNSALPIPPSQPSPPNSPFSILHSQLIPPGYKQTEVGVIPEDWEIHQLGDIGTFKNGINKNSEAFGHGFPFVNLMDIFGISAIASIEGLGLVASNYFDQKNYNLKKGDVIFIRSSVKPSGVGLTAIVENDLPETVYSGFLIRFRDSGFIDIKLKRHCFYEESFRNRLISASSVSANTNINQDNLMRLFIALPPTKAEQEAIAEALSDVDALIESLEQLIAKKHQIKKGAMQWLLTPPETMPIENGELKIDNGENSQLSTNHSRLSRRLPGFSGDWEEKRLGDVVIIRGERIDPKKDGIQEFCIELEHINSSTGSLLGCTSTGEQSSLKSVFCEGDVLFGKLRAYLRKYWLADRAGVCSTEIWIFAPNKVLVHSAYLFQIVQTHKFIEAASSSYGTHMPRSDWNTMKNFELILPQIPEQTAIAEILSDMDAEIMALEAKLVKYRQIKQGMMHELLTGRIRLV